MSYFSRKLMHQYIVAVSVTKADDIADRGPYSTRLREVNSGLVPQIWTREVLTEQFSSTGLAISLISGQIRVS